MYRRTASTGSAGGAGSSFPSGLVGRNSGISIGADGTIESSGDHAADDRSPPEPPQPATTIASTPIETAWASDLRVTVCERMRRVRRTELYGLLSSAR